MRLDSFLVEQGKVVSRGRAKRAILNGRIKVDGRPVTKPSRQVGYSNEIEVCDGIDVPAGYLKLEHIQKAAGIIHPGDVVLDLGSSAGGFLLFASKTASQVKGIEYSSDFIPRLEDMAASYDNIELIKGDVFSLPLDRISERPVDVILNDITTGPHNSVSVLERVLPLLKPKGRILQVLKISQRSLLDSHLERMKGFGLSVLHIIEPEKQEVYVIAERIQDSEAKA